MCAVWAACLLWPQSALSAHLYCHTQFICYCCLPVRLNLSGHSPLTSLINKALWPSHSWSVCFVPLSLKLKRLVCENLTRLAWAIIPQSKSLRSHALPISHVWSEQLNCFDHVCLLLYIEWLNRCLHVYKQGYLITEYELNPLNIIIFVALAFNPVGPPALLPKFGCAVVK